TAAFSRVNPLHGAEPSGETGGEPSRAAEPAAKATRESCRPGAVTARLPAFAGHFIPRADRRRTVGPFFGTSASRRWRPWCAGRHGAMVREDGAGRRWYGPGNPEGDGGGRRTSRHPAARRAHPDGGGRVLPARQPLRPQPHVVVGVLRPAARGLHRPRRALR